METKDPCINCDNKVSDDYGYLCDLACGKRTAWLNYQAGQQSVMEWIESGNSEIHNVPEAGCACVCIYLTGWQAFKQKLDIPTS